MRVTAYTYEADYHCIDCTKRRFSDWANEYGMDTATFKPSTDINGIYVEQQDGEGNFVHPVFSTDEWQEFDEGFLAENPTQYLACGTCLEVIEEYKHI